MIEYVYIAATGIIGALSGILGTLLISKYALSDEKIMDKLDMILTNVVDDVEFQKKIYSLGALLGSGIARGTGLQPGGKLKIGDIIAQAAQGFIGNMFGAGQNRQEQPNINQQPQPAKW